MAAACYSITSRGTCRSRSCTPFPFRGLDHQVVEAHLPLPAEDVQLALLELGALVHRRVDLGDGHRRVHRADVDHRLALLAVQVRHARHRLGAVELEDEGEVLVERLLGERLVLRLPERHALPVLALVLAEVQHLERLAAVDAEQPLAGDVDAPASQVTADPAAAEPLSDGERGARAAEEVGDEVART